MSSQKCYPDKSPAVDALLDTLSHNLRREIIHYFENHTEDQTAMVGGLVDHISSRVPSQTDERLQIELEHSHLPKLADRGWIDYSPQTGYVRYHGYDRAALLLKEVHDVF